MPSDNEIRLIGSFNELRNLIQQEVGKFREQLTLIISQHQRDDHLSEKPLSIKQVAERYDVSKQTVHNWMKEDIIKGFKQGKGRFFYLHELDQSLKNENRFINASKKTKGS